MTAMGTQSHIHRLTNTGLMTAILCILGPISIPLPFSLVPISLTTLGIYLAIYILGMKQGTLCTILYLLLGFVGLPIFSGFSGGIYKLVGPTGGYLIGYVFLAMITGAFIDKWPSRPILHFTGMWIATIVCYLPGTLWLAYQSGITLPAAFTAGVLPFILGDMAKIICSILLGKTICKRRLVISVKK